MSDTARAFTIINDFCLDINSFNAKGVSFDAHFIHHLSGKGVMLLTKAVVLLRWRSPDHASRGLPHRGGEGIF